MNSALGSLVWSYQVSISENHNNAMYCVTKIAIMSTVLVLALVKQAISSHSISNVIYWGVHHLPITVLQSWDWQPLTPQTLDRCSCRSWAKQQVSTPAKTNTGASTTFTTQGVLCCPDQTMWKMARFTGNLQISVDCEAIWTYCNYPTNSGFR